MYTRWAVAAFGLLILAVVAGIVFDAPDLQPSATATYSSASAGVSPSRVDYADTVSHSDAGAGGIGIALLVIGAAAIGQIFFRPNAIGADQALKARKVPAAELLPISRR